MFSGIVEEMGVVRQVDRGPGAAALSILSAKVLEDLSVGDSIAVSGVCLTVVARGHDNFSVEVSPETLRVTNLGGMKAGEAVNLERSLRMMDRVGGHLVTGHVDGVGRIQERRVEGNATLVTVKTPKEILRYTVVKGSIALDGVSMTVNAVSDHSVAVCIIPQTAKSTTLGIKGLGDSVNLESDLIGRYIERFLQHGEKSQDIKVDRGYLERRGLI